MSTRSVPLQEGLPQPQRPTLRILKREPLPISASAVRITFWTIGILLASAQAWIFRYEVSADSISYLDMSDGVLPGSSWHRLINGVYSTLYPFLLGLYRRIFHISPGNEVAAGHLLNVIFFIFAFACFEFFLVGTVRELEAQERSSSGEIRTVISLPKWAFLSVAYSVFLWAAIDQITVGVLRADMLMSGFLYLAVGLLVRMHRRPASWRGYLALGAVLGVGILAKEAMLPVGILIIATTFFAVENWRPALKMAAGSVALMLLIGCLYFVPLSLQLGHFTLGEAGRFVYVVNVDEASPHWYLQTPGSARGSFVHPPEKIFSDPPAYAFALPASVTHPLRFDPSYWIAGVRPHFVLGREVTAIKSNLRVLKGLFSNLRVILAAIFVLAFLCSSKKVVLAALAKAWPVSFIGLAGCLMYVAIFVDPRYVAAFLAVFCIGMLVGFPLPLDSGRKIAQLIVIATIAMLLYPVAHHIYSGRARRFNVSLQAAQALEGLGIRAGDPVARISPSVSDYTVERILRVQIVAEVDREHIADFWSASFATQQSLLSAFAARGVKAVIATSPILNGENQAEWSRLGSTQYWVWRPAGS
jgi:hypothetical protein